MSTRFVLPVLALLLGASACTSSRQPGENPQAEARTATLRVENQAWLNMTVYVVDAGSGARTRLGQVNSTSSATLRIPSGVVGLGRSLRFVVDPLGSQQTASSFDLYVRPGQNVTITIPPNAGR